MHVIETGSDKLCVELLVTAKLVCIDLILNVLTGLNWELPAASSLLQVWTENFLLRVASSNNINVEDSGFLECYTVSVERLNSRGYRGFEGSQCIHFHFQGVQSFSDCLTLKTALLPSIWTSMTINRHSITSQNISILNSKAFETLIFYCCPFSSYFLPFTFSSYFLPFTFKDTFKLPIHKGRLTIHFP